eukprot:357103-Rhodomonas_salina.1
MDSAGYLLDGASGVGKSTVLNHVVHWARSSGDWLVVFVPQASRLVSGLGFYARGDPEPEGEGKIILQPSFALEFLSTLVEANKEKLTKLPFQKKASTIEAAKYALLLASARLTSRGTNTTSIAVQRRGCGAAADRAQAGAQGGASHGRLPRRLLPSLPPPFLSQPCLLATLLSRSL